MTTEFIIALLAMVGIITALFIFTAPIGHQEGE